MALIKEHDALPVLHSLVGILSAECQPLVLHPVPEKRLCSHLSGRETKLLETNLLDLPDLQVLQSRHQGFKTLSRELRIPGKMLLHGGEGGLADY